MELGVFTIGANLSFRRIPRVLLATQVSLGGLDRVINLFPAFRQLALPHWSEGCLISAAICFACCITSCNSWLRARSKAFRAVIRSDFGHLSSSSIGWLSGTEERNGIGIFRSAVARF